MTIRVLVADDHEVVRRGLSNLFEDSEIEMVGEAIDGHDVVEKSRVCNPDIILMDVRMPETDGIQAIARIRQESPDIKIVMFSMYDNPTYVARAVALGASDYLLKTETQESIIEKITRVAHGMEPQLGSLLYQVRESMRMKHNARNDIPLTHRETQVLKHIALGLSNREIGSSLEISIETVKEHVQNILRKIDATDRTQAAIWAIRKGLVS